MCDFHFLLRASYKVWETEKSRILTFYIEMNSSLFLSLSLSSRPLLRCHFQFFLFQRIVRLTSICMQRKMHFVSSHTCAVVHCAFRRFFFFCNYFICQCMCCMQIANATMHLMGHNIATTTKQSITLIKYINALTINFHSLLFFKWHVIFVFAIVT